MPNLNQKSILCLFLFVLNFGLVSSQENELPTGDIVHAPIDFLSTPIISEEIENVDGINYYQVEFNSEEALNLYYQELDIDPPNYTTQMRYFWTFGDGHISYESNPIHQYGEFGTYEVTLQATPIYSPKPPPPLMKVVVDIPSEFEYVMNGVLDLSATAGELPWSASRLSLKAEMLRNFRSSFESSMIITYSNGSEFMSDDVIQVFYNSQKVDAVAVYSFQDETYEYIGDVTTNLTLTPEINTPDYKMITIPFSNLEPNETRRILIQFVSNNSSDSFDPSIYFGVNFEFDNIDMTPLIETSLRKSWDPNAKEVFVDYISSLDIPETIKYRIYMENIGPAPADNISVLDRVHSVLNIDPETHAIVASKDENVTWEYEPNLEDRNVNYIATNINLPGQSPELNIEDSKFWFDVVYDIDTPRLEENIATSNGLCREGIYSFGKNAKITFDNNPPIDTNIPITVVGCTENNLEHCIEIKRIFPNPVFDTGTLVYEVESSLDKPLNVFAVSKFGRIIPISSNLSAESGRHNYNLDFTDLRPGVYQLIIRNKYCSAKLEGFIKK